LKAEFVGGTESVYKGDYFSQMGFTELDRMQVYMFKIYQLTQAICFDSYISAIDQITYAYLQLMVMLTIFYAGLLAVWVVGMPGERRRLARLYGQLLLVPFNVLKSNSRIVNSLKEAVEYAE
jgi:hypothetical protein